MNDSYNLSMRNPILYTNPTPMYGQQTQSPTAQRLTLENQYQSMVQQMSPNQQPQQSNPYSDYLETLNSCTNLTQRKIQEDQRYQEIYNQCQSALLHEAFSQVMPSVLSTQQGRTLFERLNTTTQILKEEYTQQEIQRERQLEDREKATELEKQQLEAQKQELATMMAQIRELQQTIPTAQQAQIQFQQPNQAQSYVPSQNSPQDIVEPVASTKNDPNNQNNQQNQNNYQNYNSNRKNNNKPQNNGGNTE